jgi:hypothetical protein
LNAEQTYPKLTKEEARDKILSRSGKSEYAMTKNVTDLIKQYILDKKQEN